MLYDFTIGTLHYPDFGAWNFDTGARSHLNNFVNSLSKNFNTCMYPSVSVGDSHSIPVINTGNSILSTPTRSLHLHNVLITPQYVKNLIYVRQSVRDNNCTIKFDAFAFFVKDFLTRQVLLRCDSTGDLYPVTAPSLIAHAFFVSQHTWHQRLGHPGGEVLHRLVSSNFISCNKEKPHVLCHACHFGKHVRLPFVSSGTVISSCLDIIHSDGGKPCLMLLETMTKKLKSFGTKVEVMPNMHLAPQLSDCTNYSPYGTKVQGHPKSEPNTIRHNFTSSQIYLASSYLRRCQNRAKAVPNSIWHGILSIWHSFPLSEIHVFLVVSPVNPNLDSVYTMVTRFCVETNRPTKRLNLHVSSVSPLPKSYRDAFNDPNWQNAMRDKYTAFIKNQTWTLVHKPPNTNIVRCTWLFRHKYLADGTLSRYKARLVANGSTQLEGVDVDETFSPVIKLASSLDFLQQIISSLHQEFAINDLGSLNYFVGMSVTRDSSKMFLSQKKYVVKILEQASMVYCNPSRTPVDTESKLDDTGDVVFLHMHDPRKPHFSALKRILHYVRGTLDYGLQLFSSTALDFIAYSYAHQPTLSRSSAESEYRGVANAVAETCWLRNLLRELHTPLSSATLVYCDNVIVVYLSCNPVQHQRTKHIEIDIYFVCDLVATGQVRVLHVPFRYQFTDIFTKGLPSALFEEFRSSLSVQSPPAQTAGERLPYDL
uniref:Ribonuclease H-like domain-containing protein n=1 Tax=Tanacetum cinerariifolium TaxID=118510 RepID=A0A699H716_TANCI|nr:ribonuclease H-like domain-containing protein [Tanacetum cinerariifolium]